MTSSNTRSTCTPFLTTPAQWPPDTPGPASQPSLGLASGSPVYLPTLFLPANVIPSVPHGRNPVRCLGARGGAWSHWSLSHKAAPGLRAGHRCPLASLVWARGEVPFENICDCKQTLTAAGQRNLWSVGAHPESQRHCRKTEKCSRKLRCDGHRSGSAHGPRNQTHC